MKTPLIRFLFIYLLTSFSFLNSFSQKKNPDVFSFSKYHKRKLSIGNSKSPVKYDRQMRNLTVLDWREDTTVGFMGNDYFVIPGIENSIKNKLLLEDEFKSGSRLASAKIILCLKKLWIARHLTEENNHWQGGIIWKADCFEKVNDTFVYLSGVDTVIKGSSNTRFIAKKLIPFCLQLTTSKIKSAIEDPGKKKAYVDINQFRINYHKIPVLQKGQKKKGLYLTYEQFLNDTPTPADFEVERDKLSDAMFVKNSKGNYELVRNLWGYCDGENRYIKSGEKYFQLCRYNNTFYFYGAKYIQKFVSEDIGTASVLNVVTNTNRKITKYTLNYYPFQLEISDGKFY